MQDQYDSINGYCRKLGHHLQFNYCRSENNGLPCAKIQSCWLGIMPINEFLKDHYTSEQISYIFEPPQSKVASLIELIQKAQAVQK